MDLTTCSLISSTPDRASLLLSCYNQVVVTCCDDQTAKMQTREAMLNRNASDAACGKFFGSESYSHLIHDVIASWAFPCTHCVACPRTQLCRDARTWGSGPLAAIEIGARPSKSAGTSHVEGTKQSHTNAWAIRRIIMLGCFSVWTAHCCAPTSPRGKRIVLSNNLSSP